MGLQIKTHREGEYEEVNIVYLRQKNTQYTIKEDKFGSIEIIKIDLSDTGEDAIAVRPCTVNHIKLS